LVRLANEKKDAIEIREKDQKANKKRENTAKDGKDQVRLAVQAMKDIYGKLSLSQTHTTTRVFADLGQPKTVSDKEYKGSAVQGGLLKMLSTTADRLESMEDKAVQDEKDEQADHEEFLHDNKMAQVEEEMDKKENERQKLEKSKTQADKEMERESTQKELDAANETYDKLKPQCIDANESHEERQRKREEEITSLKEALDILENAHSG